MPKILDTSLPSYAEFSIAYNAKDTAEVELAHVKDQIVREFPGASF